MVNVVGLLETDIVPLCCSIVFLQNGKPNPVPEAFVVKSESKILGNTWEGISEPEFSTSIVMKSESTFTLMKTSPLPSIAWMALVIKFIKTTSNFEWSHSSEISFSGRWILTLLGISTLFIVDCNILENEITSKSRDLFLTKFRTSSIWLDMFVVELVIRESLDNVFLSRESFEVDSIIWTVVEITPNGFLKLWVRLEHNIA